MIAVFWDNPKGWERKSLFNITKNGVKEIRGFGSQATPGFNRHSLSYFVYITWFSVPFPVTLKEEVLIPAWQSSQEINHMEVKYSKCVIHIYGKNVYSCHFSKFLEASVHILIVPEVYHLIFPKKNLKATFSTSLSFRFFKLEAPTWVMWRKRPGAGHTICGHRSLDTKWFWTHTWSY